jgi:hypothetical protein
MKFSKPTKVGEKIVSNQPYVTHINAGSELIQTLSESLYKNAYYVLDELISNAYDAEATRVDITISAEKLVIVDNGLGMGKQGLDNYLWLGFSEKRRDRKTNNLRRYTIGKFGIGKLSMHVMCNKCKVTTVKNGVELSLLLDFERIMSHKSLSDEEIEVSERCSDQRNGTRIELLGLKKTLDVNMAIRRIAKNMPLSPDFQVMVNGEPLKAENIIKGKEFQIELSLSLTGQVSGKMVISDAPLGDFAGVYIKVYGRTVNADEPNIFDLSRVVSGFLSYVSRFYCVLNADGLDNIVLATRNGFSEEKPMFIEFKEAIIRKIREITKEMQCSQSKEELNFEKNLLEDVIRHQIDDMLKGAELPDDFLVRYSRRSDAKEVMSTINAIEERKKEKESNNTPENRDKKEKEIPPRLIKIGNRRYRFELEPLGKQAYECILDVAKSTFYINIDHPQYIFSRTENSLPHHFRRVIVFEVARILAGNSLQDFITQYSGMMLQDITIEGEKI